ncbi:hypothetical protein B0T19DRAFT_472826 [Cercophora scortea]|uniref:Zn(2)-C6 fungal-type domain-containing protein n=1 Tax=Cercophora scortea TaxID=314031 RepID=A0AAE0IV22_9PEZI|nr:hypothetical protein B0T19DRAFT_472826 [Cercophora scortea]
MPRQPNPQNRLACDRCHGQKLRCQKGPAGQGSCLRCSRSNTACVFSPRQRRQVQGTAAPTAPSIPTTKEQVEAQSQSQSQQRSSTAVEHDAYHQAGLDFLDDNLFLNHDFGEMHHDGTKNSDSVNLSALTFPLPLPASPPDSNGWSAFLGINPGSQPILVNNPKPDPPADWSSIFNGGCQLGIDKGFSLFGKFPTYTPGHVESASSDASTPPEEATLQDVDPTQCIRQLAELNVKLYEHAEILPAVTMDPNGQLPTSDGRLFPIDETFTITQAFIDVVDRLYPRVGRVSHFVPDHATVLLLLSCANRVFDIYQIIIGHMKACIAHRVTPVTADGRAISLPKIRIGRYAPPSPAAITMHMLMVILMASNLFDQLQDVLGVWWNGDTATTAPVQSGPERAEVELAVGQRARFPEFTDEAKSAMAVRAARVAKEIVGTRQQLLNTPGMRGDGMMNELWNADFVFHDNLQALIHSAESGCAFCNLCWVQIQRERTWDVDLCLAGSCNGMGGKTILDPTIYLQAHWQMPDSEQNVPSRLWISCGPLPNSEAEGLTSQGLSTSLCIFAVPGTPAESLFEGRYITVDHNPNDHIAWTQRALDFCQRNHKVCKHATHSAPRQMPTRIIDVGPPSSSTTSPTPRLVLAKDLPSPEPYTALSYCWGQGVRDKIELRQHTLATLLTSMPEDNLTRAHQDAIRFTRALGIRYLWIDALCIIQGDPADWARESKRMGSVYGGAQLTIIASRAADCADGFLANTYRSTPNDQNLPLPCPLPCGVSPVTRSGPAMGTVYVTPPRSTTGGPVDARGWCFQESLLAHRAVSFGTEQLLYSCRAAKRYEDGERTLISSAGSFRRLAGPDPGTKPTVLRAWYAMLQNFSARALTEPHDVFACIASLALIAHRVVGWRYLAGLWEGDMPRGLVWRSQFRYFLPIKTETVWPRASGFRQGEKKGEAVRRAPSWSWASVSGPVVWPAAVLRREVEGYTLGVDLFVRPREDGGRWTVDTSEGVGEPDALYMPSLELRMWARPVRVRRGGRTTGEYAAALSVAGRKEWKTAHTKYGMLLVEFESGGVVAVGYFDVLGEKEPENMWCLRVIRREGILLTRDEQGKFRRIGWLAVLEEERWFGGVGEQAVDLV